MILHENRLPADDSHEYHSLFVIFEKRQNLQLSTAANYRLTTSFSYDLAQMLSAKPLCACQLN